MAQGRLVPSEEFVLEGVGAGSCTGELAKAPPVQPAVEAAVLCPLREESWHYLRGKLGGIADDEGIPGGQPRDRLLVLGGLDLESSEDFH